MSGSSTVTKSRIQDFHVMQPYKAGDCLKNTTMVLLIILGTLTTGAANSLLTKYQDNQCVRDCFTDTPKYFNQPALQSLQMFTGELLVIFVYWFYKWYNKRNNAIIIDDVDETKSLPLIFSVPAILDLLGTSLLNIGLILTPVSVYQMTRGSVVLFVALLSVIFLKRRITKLEWISLFVVTLGVVIVGISGSKKGGDVNANNVISESKVTLGILLIIFAEIIQAGQFVVEEFILSKHPIIPLQLVYIEGFYGSSITILVMTILNFILKATTSPYKFLDSPFNLNESFTQLFSSNEVIFSSILIMISIAAFNFCGISLTHQISATARTTVDTSRTLIVWLLALLMGWESFIFLQFVGFAILVLGTLSFNGVIKPETWSWVPKSLKLERLIQITP